MSAQESQDRPKPRHFRNMVTNTEVVTALIKEGKTNAEISKIAHLDGNPLKNALRNSFKRHVDSSVRRGKPRGGNTALVYPHLLAGKSAEEIAKATGLEGEPLYWAMDSNYRRYGIERPDVETRRAISRRNLSLSKGGIAVVMEPYFPLDLTIRQTQVALAVHEGVLPRRTQIEDAYSNERRRHIDADSKPQKPTVGLSGEGLRDRARSWERLLGIVENRRETFQVVQAEGWPRPTSIQAWHALERELGKFDNRTEPLDLNAYLLLDPEHADGYRRIWRYGWKIPTTASGWELLNRGPNEGI
jgi:hypothetical protein